MLEVLLGVITLIVLTGFVKCSAVSFDSVIYFEHRVVAHILLREKMDRAVMENDCGTDSLLVPGSISYTVKTEKHGTGELYGECTWQEGTRRCSLKRKRDLVEK